MIGQAIKKLDLADLMMLLGIGLVVYGIYRINLTASILVAGIGLIFWAIQIERGKPSPK